MVEKYFSQFGELGNVLIREPEPQSLSKVPEEKRNFILNHKYAFICFKNCESAKRVVNEVTYQKLTDNVFNTELNSIIELLRKLPAAEEHLYMASCYIIENEEGYKGLINTNLKELYDNFLKVNYLK